MEDIKKSNKPRYDVLLAQLKYIEDKAADWLVANGNNKDNASLDKATDDLGGVCMMFNITECKNGYHLEDGMCVPDN